MKWRVLSKEELFRRPWLTVRRDKVELPDGRVHSEYYVLHYPTWVNVIAETDDGRLILERQYRHGLGIMSTEICAGVAEKGEEPLAAAKRELQEETGFGGGDFRPAPRPHRGHQSPLLRERGSAPHAESRRTPSGYDGRTAMEVLLPVYRPDKIGLS